MENKVYFFNTLTRKVEQFIPNVDGKVAMYTCGPTVYHFAHIGNLRSYIMEDILEKTLRYVGYDVKRVMNITDVGHLTSDADTGEDKMLKGAKREHKTVMEIAKLYTDAFFSDCKKLNIKRGRLRLGRIEALAAGPGQVEIDPGVVGGTPVFLGAGVLNAVESLPEHGVVGLLPVEQEVDGLPDPLVVDLVVQVFVNHLGPLFGRDIRQDIRRGIAGFVDIGGGPEIAAGVGEHGGQAGQDMGFHVPHRGVHGVEIVAVEHIDGGADHL